MSGRAKAGLGIVFAGCSLLAVGSFLPWLTFTGALRTARQSGVDGGDGFFTLLLAAGIGAIAFFGFYRLVARSLVLQIAWITAIATFALTFYEWGRLGNYAEANDISGVLDVEAGWGLGVCFVGAILILVGLALYQRNTDEP